MAGASKAMTILRWLKLLTYIGSTISLITNNEPSYLTYLIPLVLLLYFINYFRDSWLIPANKPSIYIWGSIIVEMMLIICVGIMDSSNISMLLFFVCITSINITYSLTSSVPVLIVYITSVYLIDIHRINFISPTETLSRIILSYGVATTFVLMMSSLVRMQIREREKLAHLNAELENAYERLIENSAMSQKLSVEQERTRMAREIHDTLAHTLTSLIIQLEVCKKLSSADPSGLQSELEKAQTLSRSGFDDVKRSIKALRPMAMEGTSFFGSIMSIIRNTMAATHTNINLINDLPSDLKLSSRVEIVLFRVIQESITNSVRHGQAGEIRISITTDNDLLKLVIEDNGLGCSNIKKGYGMQGIRERVEDTGGSVEFSSTPGKGFKTAAAIPIEVD